MIGTGLTFDIIEKLRMLMVMRCNAVIFKYLSSSLRPFMRPFCQRFDFTLKARILALCCVLSSKRLRGLWDNIVSHIDEGIFHMIYNCLKFTNIWKLAHSPKSVESHLKWAVHFISGLVDFNSHSMATRGDAVCIKGIQNR